MRFARLLAAASLVLGAACLAPPASAYPTKPVRVLIGFAPGGPTDTIARVMADHLSKTMGQPFVVEARPGAGGNIAGQILATAPPDGHTLYVNAFGMIAIAQVVYKDLPFDPATSFAPITVLVDAPMLLEVHTKHAPKTYPELVAFLKANTGKLNHGSPGVATFPHLAASVFAKRIGFDSQHIPYRGSAPFAQGMAQGEIDWSFDSANTALQLAQAGHVRILATTSRERWPSFPDVPTLTELGMKDAVWPTWFGLITVAGTPRDVIDKLHAEVKRGWQIPENAQRLRNVGFEPTWPTPDETAAFFKKERETWAPVAVELGIKAE